MKTVLCFGNEYIKEDALAKEIADELNIPGIRLLKCDDLNQIFNYPEKDLYILDVAQGIDKIVVFDDIEKIRTRTIMSLHDFDLGYFLKLMKETGKVDKIKVIAIPVKYKKDRAKKELLTIFGNLAEI